MAAALRDKVWVRHEGKTYKADVCRVPDGKNDLEPDEIDANYHVSTDPDEAGIRHHMVAGGLSKLKLAKSEDEQKKDGCWWPRQGSWLQDPAHGGRRGWQEG